MKVFAIRDSKAMAYLQPFYAPTVAVAIRLITQSGEDNGSLLHKYPSDFEVFEIGKFDEQTGKLEGSPHQSLGKVVDFIQMQLPGFVAPGPDSDLKDSL